MTRIDYINDSDLRVVRDDDGNITDIIDDKGRSQGFVFGQKNKVTGGLELSGDVLQKVGPIQRPAETLGLIGDSRTENGGYFCPAPSAASISGSTLSVTAQYIGTSAPVGSRIILSRNKSSPSKTLPYSYNLIVATVASVVDAHNITATVIYPNPATLPTGDVLGANAKCLVEANYPNYSSSPQAWILALRNRAYKRVYTAAFNGARIQDAITHQVPFLLSQGCKEFWIYIGINDICDDVDNQDTAYLIAKYKELWTMLRGYRVVQFLEMPLSSTYYSAANAVKVATINAWFIANAADYGVKVFDAYTPIVDPATGQAATGMLHDGIHHSQKGSFVSGIASLSSNAFPPPGKWEASISDEGTAAQPVLNPAMKGTLGASQQPTGYSGTAGGTVAPTIVSYGLELTESGNANQFYANLAAAASSPTKPYYAYKTANFTVMPGVKYMLTATIEVIDGIGVDYVWLNLRSVAGSTKYFDIFGQLNNGFADGSYVCTGNGEFIIPAGLTSVYISSEIQFIAAGGSATIKIRNIEMRPV